MADSGFAIEQGMLPDAECDALIKAVSAHEVVRSRAGARHLLSHSAIAELASDSRLIEIAREHVGRTAVPFRATLFEKSGSANWLISWHQDTALPLTARFESSKWGPWSEKAAQVHAHAPGWALSRVVALRVHLDASTADNGPLRVIPCSHVGGVLTDDGVRDWDAE